jgi:prepilin-type processing-associated H-X9-DG protein
MTRRPLILPFAVLLFVALAAVPACNKKKKTGDENSTPAPAQGNPGPGPVAGGGSDYVVFAHLRAKDIRESAIFTEFKQALAKSGGQAEWDELEGKMAKETGGIRPTDIDSVTAVVTDVPKDDLPKFILIVTTAKPIDKAALQGTLKTNPDAGGFHTALVGLVHFPDDKTFVLLDPDLKQKYLDGYAKNRTGWPLTAELSRAAAGHTLYATADLTKVPKELVRGPEAKEVEPFLPARAITLTADLKGKELNLAARASFPDAASAGKAKAKVQELIGMGLSQVENFLKGKGPEELSGFMPAVQEAQRALKDAKVEVSGSDLIVAGSYRANFDVGTMVVEGVKKVREAAARMKDANNLKQIGIALHNYSDVYGGRLPVHAVGPKAMALQNPKDKPLLSWRVALLPYIEQGTLYNEFKLDEPWDSPHNKKLIEKMPKIYAPPKPGKAGYTHLQMVVGPNALSPFDARMPATFTDGTSNTIAVVEAAQPVIWTKPDDVMLTAKDLPKDLKKKFGGLHPGGFNVVMWDGSVRFIKDSVSETTLSRALNPRDGMVLGSDW